jgi:hypothetical protein
MWWREEGEGGRKASLLSGVREWRGRWTTMRGVECSWEVVGRKERERESERAGFVRERKSRKTLDSVNDTLCKRAELTGSIATVW